MFQKLTSLLVLLQATLACSAQDPSSVDSKRADLCRQQLERLTDFYLKSIDEERGGYLEELSTEGEFSGNEKFLTLQARQVWFFSRVAREGMRREETLAAARSGYEFLTQHFHDAKHGGYFAKTSLEGEVVDSRKHVYPNAFVIYAMVEYYRASEDESALKNANDLFAVLDAKCYDEAFGGYQEFFYRDWQLITDPGEASYVGAVNTKTYNSHLHLLEAFTQLYLATEDTKVGERLEELIETNTTRVRSPRGAFNIDGWNRDWSLIDSAENRRASFGHDLECVWLVLEAAEALGRDPAELRKWAESLAGYSIQFGYDHRYGGFFYTGAPLQLADDRRKVWWTQCEAMVGLLKLHQMTGMLRYRKAFEGSMDFLFKHHNLVDGSCWNTVNQDGSAVEFPSRTSMWQGAYHNGRALLICEQLLRRDKDGS